MLFSCKKEIPEPKNTKSEIFFDSLTVYAVKYFDNSNFYERIKQLYQNEYNVKINYKFFNDAYTLLDSLKYCDVIMGLDKTFYSHYIHDTLFIDYRPINYQDIKRELRPYEKIKLIPFAYNYNVFFYKDKIKNYPKTLGSLQDNDFTKTLIIFDPFTTSLGRDFMLQSLATFTNLGYRRFWVGIRKNIYSIESNVSFGAKEFLENDKLFLIYYPLINPYIKSSNYFLPAEGYYCQIQYIGIPYFAHIYEKSKKFVDFLLYAEVQREVFKSDYGIPVSIQVLDEIGDSIKLKKQGLNLCKKPKSREIELNLKYMKLIWKRTFKKFYKKKKRIK